MPDNLSHLPEEKRLLLENLLEQLTPVPGISAIVLGGSYASGTHHAASDMDIGLYYFDTRPFSIDDIRRIAEKTAAGGKVTVTGFYEWGAWVNGGAWIHTPYGKVDFIYRSIEHVQRTIDEAHQGIIHHDYDQQPAYGYYSVTYLAETQICVPLYDPAQVIARLKQDVEPYPPRLKQKIINASLWLAEFSLLQARGFASQGDVYNTVGCLTRVAAYLTQALFAVNERYYLRDKKVMETLGKLVILPPGYPDQIQRILAHPGGTAGELVKTVQALENAWKSVIALPGVAYEPAFKM